MRMEEIIKKRRTFGKTSFVGEAINKAADTLICLHNIPININKSDMDGEITNKTVSHPEPHNRKIGF
jgi:DNA repair protein RadC